MTVSSNHSSDNAVLLGQDKQGAATKTLTTVKDIDQNWYKEYRLSLLIANELRNQPITRTVCTLVPKSCTRRSPSMVSPREKCPPPDASEKDRTCNATSRRTASPTHYQPSCSVLQDVDKRLLSSDKRNEMQTHIHKIIQPYNSWPCILAS